LLPHFLSSFSSPDHSPSPPVSVCVDEPTARADGAPPSDEAQVTYSEASEQYMIDLRDYEDWCDAEARATQIVLGSM
jgi:hypothetical protein